MPYWGDTIDLADIFHNEDMPFEEKRDEIVKRIKDSKWLSYTDWYYELLDVVKELEVSPTIEDFDFHWQTVYDYADIDRVWIDTF